MESSKKASLNESITEAQGTSRGSCKYVLFCGNAGKDIKKLVPTIIPCLAQSKFNVKKVTSFLITSLDLQTL